MSKKYFIAMSILATTAFFGCQPAETPVAEDETVVEEKVSLENETYLLVTEEGFTPSYLELKSDGTFTLDFNVCEAMATGSGKYTLENDIYTLDVAACDTCKEGRDGGLPSVNLELKKTAADELKIQNEVFRIENGEKLSFCAPSNDPENKYGGVDYNTFKKVTTKEGLTKSKEEGNIVYYDGEITVSGTYRENFNETLGGYSLDFDADEETGKLIPRDPNHWGEGQADTRNPWFAFSNYEEALAAFEIDAKALEGKCIEGKATVKITEYQVPKIESEVWDTATLVEIVSKEPYEIVDCQ